MGIEVRIVTGIVNIYPIFPFDYREVHCPTSVNENLNIALDIIRTSERCLYLCGSYHSNETSLCASASN